MIMNVNIMSPRLPTEGKVMLDYSSTRAPRDFYLPLFLPPLFPGLTLCWLNSTPTFPISFACMSQKHCYISTGLHNDPTYTKLNRIFCLDGAPVALDQPPESHSDRVG